jgi:hypothetical protein
MNTAIAERPRIEPAQAMAIAHDDAAKVYKNLDHFRISIALEADGWHVDYRLHDPYRKGGGPHYVIHPSTGEILQKRYEQ